MLLEFKNNNSLHEDLILHFDGKQIVCDSFYLWHDRLFYEEKDISRKVNLILIKLLEQWLDFVSNAKSDETIYLPFGFDDQGTICLKCKFCDFNVELELGSLDIEGWSFYPSDISKFVRSDNYFYKSKDTILKLNKLGFCNQIKANIDFINKQLSP